jgi:hypothetical protein
MYETNSQEYLVTLRKEGEKDLKVALDDEDMAIIMNSGEYEIVDEKPLPERVEGMEVFVE